eukprot:XP_016659741.1 PREDICTED: phosphatidylinositol 4-phosphate 5-kinase type-1 beta isoform X2 [Acyrthosiphon pisum]
MTPTIIQNSYVITERFITITGPTPQDLLAQDNDKEFEEKLVDGEFLTDQQIDLIMGSIQLGIKHEIERRPPNPELNSLPDDFKVISKMTFDNWRDTNNNIQYPDFSFSTYAPLTFHYFRRLFGINPKDYVASFCNSPLNELANPGASKSLFYLTPDDKLIMKTVQQTEDECLLRLLPSYTTYLTDNRESLLPKFSGFYNFQSKSIDNKFVSMNNLLPSNIKMHQKFDLKGSTLGRKASDSEKKKNSPTFKDLDFNCELHPEGIFLKQDTRLALLKAIEKDCKILKDFNIMDYSILIGVHYIDRALKTVDKTLQKNDDLKAAAKRWDRLMTDSVGEKSIQVEAWPVSDENDASLSGSIPAMSVNGEKLLLFVGIIDILQTFRTTKSLEHSLKSFKLKITPGVTETANSFSVQRPEFYASRFLKYMTNSVFKSMLSPQELQKLSEQQVGIPLSSKRGCTNIASNSHKLFN